MQPLCLEAGASRTPRPTLGRSGRPGQTAVHNSVRAMEDPLPATWEPPKEMD